MTRPLLAIAMVLTVAGCSLATPSNSPGGAGPTPTNRPAADTGPSRASLIQLAVDEGRIDQVTGLIYRAYAALGMAGLPEEFASAAPLGDDSLVVEMIKLMPQLSEADKARLEPFTVRPTDQKSIFHAQPTAAVGGQMLAEDRHPTAQCTTWADSGDLDTRFKVWACADNDADAAEIDIATVVSLLDSIWTRMTAPTPAGMGPPKADTTAPDPNNVHGGDGRIDFYLLDLGQIIRRDSRNNEIEDDASAMANATGPFSGSTSSGFVLLNRYRLSDEIDMRQDVIHELFHVLEYGLNVEAPFDAPTHWFVEASAEWAVVYFDGPHSDRPHRRFINFQVSPEGLESPDLGHTYAAYIWPFFMQQEKQGTSVFSAWAAIGAIGAGSHDAVSEAVSAQLPFKENFHEFAVRNLNIENTLFQAGVKTYEGFDGHFWENEPPDGIVDATVVPGEPYISPPGGAAPLAADYYDFDITAPAREVTISIVNVNPGDQADGDALVHIEGGSWERRPLVGKMLKFCRDNPPDNIDSVVLVVSNHGRQAGLTGSVEASAKDKCSNDKHLGGTLHWTRESKYVIHRAPDLPDWVRTVTVTGTAEIVLLVRDTGYHYELSAERGGGSTYNYDYSFHEVGDPDSGANDCDTHETGTLETYAGVPDADFGDWSIGRLNPIGGLFEDIILSVDIRDWCGPQMGKDIPEELRNSSFDGFINCPEDKFDLTAEFNGSGGYVVDCSYDYDRSVAGSTTDTGTGSVSVTLTMLDGPHPTPR